tara:strand:+ start:19 stop:999 length:981 start_codon:yes stop_codon:yes gene_type:complete
MLVSLIIPTYNRASFLPETLESIESQTYSNWECIVVDDGSTDHTEEMIQQYVQRDNRFRYYKRPSYLSKGANACRNFGFKMARGNFVKWFDSDDIMLKDALEQQIIHLNKNPDIDFSIAYASYFKDHSTPQRLAKPGVLHAKDSLYHFIKGNLFFSIGGPLWRTSYLKRKKILFDESIHRLQDTEFHFRHLLAGARFQFLDASLFSYRTANDDRITQNSSDQNLLSIFKYWNSILKYLKIMKISKKKELQAFLANNISLLYYRIIKNHSTFITRGRAAMIYKEMFFNALKAANVSRVSRMRIMIGVISMVFFRRGLHFFRIHNPSL